MDKGRRDARRGTNRFPKKQSGSGFPGKPKKVGFFKKLGLTGEVNSCYEDHHQQEMVEIGDLTKKSKLPKRNFKDANGVDHASVPRKLRSAMKKRRLESVSRPPLASKKLNQSKTGVESPKKDCVKKEKPEMEYKVITEPITKDEEEVVETLFSLAGMFPGTDSTDKTGRLDDGLPDEKEAKLEIIKVAEVDSSWVAGAEPTMAESRDAPVSVLSSAKTKQVDEMPLRQAENLNGSTGTLDFLGRLKQSSVNVIEAHEKKLGIALAVKAVETKVATSDVDYDNSGLALWPGLSSTVNPGANILPKPSALKVLPWMGRTASPSKIASFGSDPSTVQMKKLNRCASHIYISRLIRVSQTSSSPSTLQQNEPRLAEVSVSDSRSITNCLEKVTRAGDAINCHAKRYPNVHFLDKSRTHNAKLVQDTELALELHGLQPSRNQSYDFLSLSSAGDSKINSYDARNGSASISSSVVQSHFPLSNSIPQHHPVKTFSMPQPETCHISSAYNNQLPAASMGHQGRLQVPPYLPGSYTAAYHSGSVAVSKQHQQQQQFWAAQYRAAAGNSVPLNQFAALQNGKQNHTLNPNSQASIASFHTTCTRYNNISQQQQQQQQRLMAGAAPMPMNHHPSRAVNIQEHHFPLVYEDRRTPLQLLCNEQS